MSLHVSHIPLLYCLLYYRTGSERAENMLVGSEILARDTRSADIDPNNDLFVLDSSHGDRSSGLDSEEEKERATVYLPSYPHYFDNVLFPWRQILHHPREPWFRHRLPRRNAKRNYREIHRLCSAAKFRTARAKSSGRGHTQTSAPGAEASLPHFAYERQDRKCLFRDVSDVRDFLPDAFMSPKEMEELLPLHSANMGGQFTHGQGYGKVTKHSKLVTMPDTHSSLKAEPHKPVECGACFTELAYDVFEEITDISGNVHQVINFNNAFQFIPIGRCKNELSACGGGQGATCRQVYRAHWSLVFSAESGARLVPHEVPSHCECMNVATAGQRGETPTASV